MCCNNCCKLRQIGFLAPLKFGHRKAVDCLNNDTELCCGRVKSHLSIRTNLFENLPDLGLEAHVQHSVGLVQNHVGHAEHEITIIS
jgi:hypothetical protein